MHGEDLSQHPHSVIFSFKVMPLSSGHVSKITNNLNWVLFLKVGPCTILEFVWSFRCSTGGYCASHHLFLEVSVYCYDCLSG